MRLGAMVIFGWLMLVVAAMAAGRFVLPADGPVAFRRDRLPLEAEQMHRLSQDLVIVAGAMDGTQAEGRRAVAQSLALSLALHPGNAKARRLLRDWRQGEHGAASPPGHVDRVADRWVPLMDWLASDAAGSDAQALAACLCDVMIPAGMTREARLAKWMGRGESGAWGGWVPDLEAFDPQRPSRVAAGGDPFKPDEGSVAAPEKREDPVVRDRLVDFELKLRNALVVTPVWKSFRFGRRETWELVPQPLMLSATQGDASGEFSLRIGSGGGVRELRSLENRVESLLKGYFGTLPKGLELRIAGEEIEAAVRAGKDLSLTAPMVALCSSVLTGREPLGGVIGTINREQKFLTGKNLWPKLQSLVGGSGGRLVVPVAAEECLMAMLTANGPEFFLKYEVMVADDMEELLARSLNGGGPKIEDGAEKFRVIQEFSKNQDLLDYVANTHVKKRLEEVLAVDPAHMSAKLLLRFGNGRQSPWLPKVVLLEELLRIIEPASKVGQISYTDQYQSDFTAPNAAGMERDLRQELGRLQPLSESTDRDWVNRADRVLEKLSELARALAIMDTYERRSAVVEASRGLHDLSSDLKRDIRRELR